MHLLGRKKEKTQDVVISAPTLTTGGGGGAAHAPQNNQMNLLGPAGGGAGGRIPNLDEEIRAIWVKPIKNTPINKDLPRLAPRIHVVLNDAPVLSSVPEDLKEAAGVNRGGAPTSPRSQPKPQPLSHQQSRRLMNNVEQRISVMIEGSDLARQLRLQPELLKNSKLLSDAVDARIDGKDGSSGLNGDPKKDKKAFAVWITKQLPPEVYVVRRATEKWTSWDGPGVLKLKTDAKGVLVELKLKNDAEACCKFNAADIADMADSTRYFAAKIREPMMKERICGFAFHAREEAILFREILSSLQLECLQSNEHESMKMLRPVQKAVIDVAQHLETRDVVARLDAAFSLIASQKVGDLEVCLPDLWKALGEESRTSRVFKAIHQNIIFIGVFHLKKAIPNILTRDVRTTEGWQIYVHLLPDVVVITHVRREQALANQPPEEYFWVEWQLRMIFDSAMTDMRSARLRVTNIGFGEKTSEAKKREYNTAFGGGNLILY